MKAYETPAWPFRKARWFTDLPTGQRVIRVFCVHDMEWRVGVSTAEDCAREFEATDTKKSAHICVDTDSVVQCVRDSDVAYAAPGANSDGIHMELAGFQRFTRAEWLAGDNLKVLEKGAHAAACYAKKYSLPVRRLSVAEVRGGSARGFCGHADVTLAFPEKGHGHMDPGEHFPWDHFLARVQSYVQAA